MRLARHRIARSRGTLTATSRARLPSLSRRPLCATHFSTSSSRTGQSLSQTRSPLRPSHSLSASCVLHTKRAFSSNAPLESLEQDESSLFQERSSTALIEDADMTFSETAADPDLEHAKYVVQKIHEEGLPKAQRFYFASQKICDDHPESEKLRTTIYESFQSCKTLASSLRSQFDDLVRHTNSQDVSKTSNASRKQVETHKRRKRVLTEEIDNLNLRFRREFDRAEEAYFVLSAEHEVSSGLKALERYVQKADDFIKRQSLLVGSREHLPEWATKPTGPEFTEKGEHFSNPLARMEKLREDIKHIHEAAKLVASGEEWKPPLAASAQKVSESISSNEKTLESDEASPKLAGYAAKEPVGPLRYMAKSKLKELRELYWKSLHSVDHPNETLRTELDNSLSRQLECRNVAYAKFSQRKQAVGIKQANKLGYKDGIDMGPVPIQFDIDKKFIQKVAEEALQSASKSSPRDPRNRLTGEFSFYNPDNGAGNIVEDEADSETKAHELAVHTSNFDDSMKAFYSEIKQGVRVSFVRSTRSDGIVHCEDVRPEGFTKDKKPVRPLQEKIGEVIQKEILDLFNNRIKIDPVDKEADIPIAPLAPEHVKVDVRPVNFWTKAKREEPKEIMNSFGINTYEEEAEKWQAVQPRDTGVLSHYVIEVKLQLDDSRGDEPYLRALLHAYTEAGGLKFEDGLLSNHSFMRFAAKEQANDFWDFKWFAPVLIPDLSPWVPEEEQRVLGIDSEARLRDDPIDQVDDDMMGAYWRNVGLGVTPVESAAKVTMEVAMNHTFDHQAISDIVLKHCRSILTGRETLSTKRQRRTIKKSPHVHSDAKMHIQQLFFRRQYTFVCPVSQRRRVEWMADEVIANGGDAILRWESTL